MNHIFPCLQCADIRNYQKEIEKLKQELSASDTKLKWNTNKIKQETDLKTAAEQRIEELMKELHDCQTTEQQHQKNEVDTDRLQVLEKQTVEQQAALILLKHETTAKEAKVCSLKNEVQQLTNDLKEHEERSSQTFRNNQFLSEDNEKLRSEFAAVQTVLDREVLKVADLQSKLSDSETVRAHLRM